MSKKILKEENIIKETKYCNIMNQGKVGDDEYTYTIARIYIKELKRNEVSSVYIRQLEEVMKLIFQEVLM